MAKIVLYHMPKSRSGTTMWLLEELGEPFEVRRLEGEGASRQPDYLAVNPLGKVPCVVVDGIAVAETSAIALYLADTFPSALLAPGLDDPLRARYLQWMVYYPGAIEPALVEAMRGEPLGPRAQMAWGDAAQVVEELVRGVEKGPWLLGDRFSAADVVVGGAIGFGLRFNLLEKHPALVAYSDRIDARSARQRAFARDEA